MLRPKFVTIPGRSGPIMPKVRDATSEGAAVSTRVAARLAWAVFGLAMLLWMAALALNLSRPQDATLSETTGDLVFALAFLPYG
jgi:hypothetical protein